MDVALSPNGKRLMRIFFTLVVVFLYAPIAILVAFSFNQTSQTAVWRGFTLDWFTGSAATGPPSGRSRVPPARRASEEAV